VVASSCRVRKVVGHEFDRYRSSAPRDQIGVRDRSPERVRGLTASMLPMGSIVAESMIGMPPARFPGAGARYLADRLCTCEYHCKFRAPARPRRRRPAPAPDRNNSAAAHRRSRPPVTLMARVVGPMTRSPSAGFAGVEYSSAALRSQLRRSLVERVGFVANMKFREHQLGSVERVVFDDVGAGFQILFVMPAISRRPGLHDVVGEIFQVRPAVNRRRHMQLQHLTHAPSITRMLIPGRPIGRVAREHRPVIRKSK